MFQRIATGWEFGMQSFGVLRHDKELVLFPLMSGAACLLVMASFAIPLWSTPWFRQRCEDQEAPQNPIVYVILFAFYVINYFVVVFFNAALVSCALKRLAGGNPTVGYGLKQAMSRLPQIAAWALVSGTVGFVLKTIESTFEKIGQLGRVADRRGWAIATYFVVPVLVVEKVGPWEALKRSTTLIRRTWGEALVGNMGIGLIDHSRRRCRASRRSCSESCVGGDRPDGWRRSRWRRARFGSCVASLVSARRQSVLLTALYLYASEGTAPPQFDAPAAACVRQKK